MGLLARLPPAVLAPLVPHLAAGLHALTEGNNADDVAATDHWAILWHLLAVSVDGSPAARSVPARPAVPPTTLADTHRHTHTHRDARADATRGGYRWALLAMDHVVRTREAPCLRSALFSDVVEALLRLVGAATQKDTQAGRPLPRTHADMVSVPVFFLTLGGQWSGR
jgi:hypothetical protein